MNSEKYAEKAQRIIQSCREAGSTRFDLRSLLELEPINLALMETLARIGVDESVFDQTFNDMLPIARNRLIQETVEIYGLGNSSSVDYQNIVNTLIEIEENGGRLASEPRTISGESLIIATLLAITTYPDNEMTSDVIQQYIENNYMNIYEELVTAMISYGTTHS